MRRMLALTGPALGALALLLASMTVLAGTIALDAIEIDIDDGWVDRSEHAAGATGEHKNLLRVQHPNGSGTLTLQSLPTPESVDVATLRNLTNVPSETPLTYAHWGDFAGFQYDYAEGGTFYRQWWLADQRALVLVSYQYEADPGAAEREAVDRMVGSLRTRRTDEPH
jgi:hypothetical protein